MWLTTLLFLLCALLCREAKYLQLIGVHVPEAARTLLLQEEKFNYYFSQLSFAVSWARCRVRCRRSASLLHATELPQPSRYQLK
jgi:hypothetical protein